MEDPRTTRAGTAHVQPIMRLGHTLSGWWDCLRRATRSDVGARPAGLLLYCFCSMAVAIPAVVATYGLGDVLSFATGLGWQVSLVCSMVSLIALSVAYRSAWLVSRTIREESHKATARQRQLADLSVTQRELERVNNTLRDELAQRHGALAELEANEVHFRALVETSGDMVWAVDASGCFTYINGAAVEAVLGYRAEDVIGVPFTHFATPACAPSYA